MLIGYVRVSTADQTFAQQSAHSIVVVFDEGPTGTVTALMDQGEPAAASAAHR